MTNGPSITRTAELVLIGAGRGALQRQLEQLLAALDDVRDLCLIRVFYRHDLNEAGLRRAIATALTGVAVQPVLTMVPVKVPCPAGSVVSLEAMAVLGSSTLVSGVDDLGFAAGLRRGRFVFTKAVRTSGPVGMVAESRGVMAQLSAILTDIGAGFADVVRMNRWYHAAGTKDEWEPSARAVAACYTEPGPIATAICLPAPLPGGGVIQIELMGMLAEDGTELAKTHSWPAGHWNWPIHLPYKHGLACGGLAFVGGQVALDVKAEVLEPEDMERQIALSLDNVAKVLAGFGAKSRLLHLGIYSEVPPGGFGGKGAAATALQAAGQSCPSVTVGFDHLSYPKMRVEIEAIAELG